MMSCTIHSDCANSVVRPGFERSGIPEEAVEAAAKKLAILNSDAGDQLTDEEWARELLKAAAPFIRAQALEDAADKVMGPSDVPLDAPTCRWIAMEMRERAAAERVGE